MVLHVIYFLILMDGILAVAGDLAWVQVPLALYTKDISIKIHSCFLFANPVFGKEQAV